MYHSNEDCKLHVVAVVNACREDHVIGVVKEEQEDRNTVIHLAGERDLVT